MGYVLQDDGKLITFTAADGTSKRVLHDMVEINTELNRLYNYGTQTYDQMNDIRNVRDKLYTDNNVLKSALEEALDDKRIFKAIIDEKL